LEGGSIREEALRRRRRQPKRGLFVLVVGPDGCGKSTLAQRLIDKTKGDFANVLHMHWRPGLLPRAGSLVGSDEGDPSTPHAREPHGPLLSLALLTYHWVDFFLGTWLRIVPRTSKGGLVVMERGWFDIAVDPRRYRLTVPQQVVELLGQLLPGPGLVIVLQTDPEVLIRRKAELPMLELSRQMSRWRQISFSRRTIRLALDASLPIEVLVDEATRVLLTTK
jgi:thymidylate kinase